MKHKTIGFPISAKKTEKRISLVPNDLSVIKHPQNIYIEQGYGLELGFSDKEYSTFGVNIASREDVLKQDIICDAKIGDASYLSKLTDKTLFGWVHAVQNKDITDQLIYNKNTVYAWEDMHTLTEHVFWKNNEIAGEAATLHAFILHGKLPCNLNVAVIGRGNSAKGALNMLNKFNANTTIYNRKNESSIKNDIHLYDAIINCVLWDTTRTDHIITEQDLKRMRPNSLIIDISCDRNGGIETSIPTTIDDPTYDIHGVRHYVVDNTPSLLYREASEFISKTISSYIDLLITNKPDDILKSALIIDKGIIKDSRINVFQKRLG